nr:HAD-IA family hydrolase [Actinomyces viscosus]
MRAVLLDADGVLQLIGTPWDEVLTRGGGPAFAQAVIDGEADALAGRETLTDLLERVVETLGLDLRASDLLEMWHRATPDPLAWQLVGDLRSAGYTTVLATNQQWERRAWMREHLGYDGLCDIDGYSCTLGVAKPDAAYFHRLLELAGVGAGQALFVDDSATNIAAARKVGLRTIHHPADAGGDLLRREVAQALTRSATPPEG